MEVKLSDERKKNDLMNLSLFENNEKISNILSSKSKGCRIPPETTSNSAQLRTPCELPYLDALSDIREIDVQTEENAPFTDSSENIESCYRPENDIHEAYNISPIVMDSTETDTIESEDEDSINKLNEEFYNRQKHSLSGEIPNWCLVTNISLDFRDNVCLGVMKKKLNLWMKEDIADNVCISYRERATISNRLEALNKYRSKEYNIWPS
ncbi:hypothetical protein HNY73_009743 [Argiope bruennichi]|uniref:Uncharacterized protein n=1 Tax=Argiope bruennichi TaxID=94029 RepID=A0A8T0FD13_ARGBR|nr:hypothetical protein HNY73_009743 [Argiope bruennichi]